MKTQVNNLWRLCFDDSEAFVNLYFRLRYTDQVNVSVVRDGEVIAALQMLPYPMTFCGGVIPTAYISGACTHPDYRNQGVMRHLLKQTFEKMWLENVALATLIPAEPWLFDYYARSGFATVLHSEKPAWQDVETPALEAASLHTYKAYDEEAYRYIDRKLRQQPCCILHTRDDFKVVMEDLQLEDGSLHVWKQNGEIVALKVAYPAPYVPTWGMARIVHVEEILQRYAAAHPDKELHICLTDEQLPQNNACYTVSQGLCRRQEEADDPNAYQSYTINRLTQEILAPLRPTMTLMLN